MKQVCSFNIMLFFIFRTYLHIMLMVIEMKVNLIVLASGEGKRMKSDIPKWLQRINNHTFFYFHQKINHIFIQNKYYIISKKTSNYENAISKDFKVLYQGEKKGSMAPLFSVESILDADGASLIIPCDMPLIENNIYEDIFQKMMKEQADAVVLTSMVEKNLNYGSILNIEDRIFIDEKEKFPHINLGVYLIKNKWIIEYLEKVPISKMDNEYKMTDLINLISKEHRVLEHQIDYSFHYKNMNTPEELAEVDRLFYYEINSYWISKGVKILDSNNTYIDVETKIEYGATIEQNTIIKGKSLIGRSIIGAGTYLENAIIDNDTIIQNSRIINSTISSNCVVGPYSHIHTNTIIDKNCCIGNFVEIKNSIIGEKNFIKHLCYIGDTKTGEEVNFGAGVIIANYDGIKKNFTKIGKKCFIGCNSNLIAPIEIEDNCFIAAGSTVSKSIKENNFVIERANIVVKKRGI